MPLGKQSKHQHNEKNMRKSQPLTACRSKQFCMCRY